MNAIIDMWEYVLRKSDVLVLADVHDERASQPQRAHDLDDALSNCRSALAHARARGTPVAFARRRPTDNRTAPVWQPGFMPRRDEMLFERTGHSCYASDPFAAMVESAGGRFALAGFFGETSCIATMIDAANRGHRVTFITDASFSRPRSGLTSSELHRAITSCSNSTERSRQHANGSDTR